MYIHQPLNSRDVLVVIILIINVVFYFYMYVLMTAPPRRKVDYGPKNDFKLVFLGFCFHPLDLLHNFVVLCFTMLYSLLLFLMFLYVFSCCLWFSLVYFSAVSVL